MDNQPNLKVLSYLISLLFWFYVVGNAIVWLSGYPGQDLIDILIMSGILYSLRKWLKKRAFNIISNPSSQEDKKPMDSRI